MPKLPAETYFPKWPLERRKPAERALNSVVATCYLPEGSTRRMDELVKSLGITGLSKSAVMEMAGCQIHWVREAARSGVWRLAGFGKEHTVNVNRINSDPDAGSVDAQVARISEQAQAEGLQLTGAAGLLPDIMK